MNKDGALPLSIEIHIRRSGEHVEVSARGNRQGDQEQPSRIFKAPPWTLDTLLNFGSQVQRASTAQTRLSPSLKQQAQDLYEELLKGDIGQLLAERRKEAGTSLLVRLMIEDDSLRRIPWEVLCDSSGQLGYWSTLSDLLPVRSVPLRSLWQAREVRGTLRLLAISPLGTGIAKLKESLADSIAKGALEWLEPLEGPATTRENVMARLRQAPFPHVLHYIGDCGLNAGIPELRTANQNEAETWLHAEGLAKHLHEYNSRELRLVVLQGAENEHPTAFAEAAHVMVSQGLEAVVTTLSPVDDRIRPRLSHHLYRFLLGDEPGHGDIALALNKTRQELLQEFDASAEALMPMLYLRGPSGRIFDFQGRKLIAPKALGTSSSPSGPKRPHPALGRILAESYSLLLGDRWKDHQQVLGDFREKLRTGLLQEHDPTPSGLPMGTLAQRFALRRGKEDLDEEFQSTFQSHTEIPPLFRILAKRLKPGVHSTLLRHPWLERSLAEEQPQRMIYVIQPTDSRVLLMRRAPQGEWESLASPESIHLDLKEDILILRAYRGYTAKQTFQRPLLTEDDYYLKLRELWTKLPQDLSNQLLRALNRNPALILGVSMLTSHHRILLHNLYDRGLPRESLAVVEPEDRERKLWESGAGLPGKDEGIEVLESGAGELHEMLETISREQRS